MFSKKGAPLLQEPTEERSYGSTSNSGPATEAKTKKEAKNSKLTSSAPAVLEPSKDASRPSKPPVQQTFEDSSSPPINPWRTLVTCSCPEPSAVVPISSHDQTNGNADQPQVDGQRTFFSSFVNAYKNTAMAIRNSLFIHVFQVLFSVIPISAIVMGALFDGKCDASVFLPAYGGTVGFLGVIFTGSWIFISVRNRLCRSVSDVLKMIFLCIFTFFSISVILDICVFGAMACSFDKQADNYCNKTFYDYAFYKHIATGATVIFALVLYLPGSLHYINWHCFQGSRNF